MKVASAHPFPNNDPHCLSIPKVQRCCVSRYAMIDDINFAAMSPNVLPLHLLGFDRSPVFGLMNNLIVVNSSSV